jgi:3-dehydroquinate dehydratase II
MSAILLIQGANTEWFGVREPEVYGTTTAAEIDQFLRREAEELGIELDIFYTNHEGEAIDRIYRASKDGVDGLMMNPAGFSYAGYALRDCIKGTRLPYVEVHLSNIDRRGIKSVIAEAAKGVVFGFGVDSYRLGLLGLLRLLEHKSE